MDSPTTQYKGPATETGRIYVSLSPSVRIAADTADWVRKIEAEAAATERAAIRAAVEEARLDLRLPHEAYYTVLAILDSRP